MERKELNKSPFETVKSEKIELGRFNVVQDEVRVNGNIRPYDYLEMMEGVSILPFHGENIITLREYRYPIRSWQTELPGGLIDPGETPKQAAVRELKEETGYEAEEVISLGYFYPSFGSTDEKIHLFAIQCGKLGEESLDPAEVLKIHEVSIKEFQELVASGEVKHGAGLAAWARWISREKDEK